MENVSIEDTWISTLSCECRPVLHKQCWDKWEILSGTCVFCRNKRANYAAQHEQSQMIIVLFIQDRIVYVQYPSIVLCIIICYIIYVLLR